MKQTKWDYSTLNLIAATEWEMLLTCKVAWRRIKVTNLGASYLLFARGIGSFLEIEVYICLVLIW